MKQIPVKAVSAVLACSMLFSIAACSKKGGSGSGAGADETSHSGKKITEDMPWFNGEVLSVDDVGLDKSKELDYSYQRLVGTDDNYIVVMTTGYYKMPEVSDSEWDTFDFSAYSINTLAVIDKATNKTVKTIDLNDSLESEDYPEAFTYENGTVTARLSTYDPITYEMMYKEMDIDVSTGEVSDVRECESSQGNIENTFQVGDYKIDTEYLWEDINTYYNLYVTDPSGDSNKVVLKKDGEDYNDIPIIFSLGGSKALVPMSVDGEYIFFELDMESLEVTEAEEHEYDWIDLDNCYSSFNGADGNVYFTTPLGVSKFDFENKTTELFFNYSWCSVNRSVLAYLEIAEVTEDSIILCGSNYKWSGYGGTEDGTDFCIAEFTRADSNPHAGKTILELYSPYGYTEDKIGDAILKFNESSSDYFIEVDDRYTSLDDSDYSDAETDDDYQQVALESDANMSNQLAMDIMNGEGPDILMNASYYGQLNNSNYLTDLTPYIGTLDSDKYFTNIVEAAKTDGALFNLPVCFQIEGIQTFAEYAGKSGVGFTTEEYEEFLKDTLNGSDLINAGQAYYFAKLFNASGDDFIKNGKADFSGPEFAALAEFVKDNVNENCKSWDELYGDPVDDYTYSGPGVGAMVFKGDMAYDDPRPARYQNCYGMSNYLSTMAELQGADAILGLPSSDGRGPMLTPYISVAVSAQALDVDACAEFVKLLLSDEVQLDFAMKDNFVLNREAFREAGMACVDYFNGEGYENYFGYDDSAMQNRITFSEQNIDDLEEIVMSCTSMNSTDAAINLILIEEMPAYFSGQKSLDDVIKIAEDRVQKVLDERG
ncbi:MAG: hypothetical protein K6E12_09775 [Saccharofermentans sp.]|nr:hypothetical protein [Saccharofermentans sp.]